MIAKSIQVARSRAARIGVVMITAAIAFTHSYPASAQFAVTTRADPGAVRQEPGNSDAFIWRLFATQVALPASPGQQRPVTFETWASDGDVFTTTPHFPSASEPHKFHGSVFAAAKPGSTTDPATALSVPCSVPQNPFVDAFPTAGSPTPCIAEEVKRNRPQYDYIVNNGLNTQAGLASAYTRSFDVEMPAAAVAVKTDWVPVPTLMQWIPQLASQADVERLYLTTTSNSIEYALVSLHVVSKQNPAWVWATFEHSLTPGRCDFVGCFDTFGAVDRFQPPHDKAFAEPYPACRKTPVVEALMARNGLAPVWKNYCLKGTQVAFTSRNGTPSALGNSVTEGMEVNVTSAAASCMGCHAYASFGPKGTVTPGALTMLGYNPTGVPIPSPLAGARPFDFMWGVLLAPAP